MVVGASTESAGLSVTATDFGLPRSAPREQWRAERSRSKNGFWNTTAPIFNHAFMLHSNHLTIFAFDLVFYNLKEIGSKSFTTCVRPHVQWQVVVGSIQRSEGCAVYSLMFTLSTYGVCKVKYRYTTQTPSIGATAPSGTWHLPNSSPENSLL